MKQKNPINRSVCIGLSLLIIAAVIGVWIYCNGGLNSDSNGEIGNLNVLDSIEEEMETNVEIDGVKNGDTIVVDYVGKQLDGTVFDTSIQSVAEENGLYNPARDYTSGLEFVAGAGQMIKGFDEAVIGMHVGETKTVEIPAEKAYGERSDDYIYRIPLSEAGDVSDAEVGMQVILGGMVPAIVTEITDSEIVFDANHELAGKTLVFDITIKENRGSEDIGEGEI